MLYVIKGPPKSGKTFLANALRNQAFSRKFVIEDAGGRDRTIGGGCLLLDEDQQGAPRDLLNKLIVGDGVVLGEDGAVDIEATRWKPEPVVIAVGDHGEALLSAIEAIAPGFAAMVGPASVLALEARA